VRLLDCEHAPRRHKPWSRRKSEMQRPVRLAVEGHSVPDAVLSAMETETAPLPDCVASAWDTEGRRRR
jgi:hypothetical protein